MSDDYDDEYMEEADEVMKYLLTKIHFLQQFIKSKGHTDDDLDDFISEFTPNTLH
tara:strand:- start:12284 stop:12448 length:165 start_codon:yes stop_codon:yes gene_type:complete